MLQLCLSMVASTLMIDVEQVGLRFISTPSLHGSHTQQQNLCFVRASDVKSDSSSLSLCFYINFSVVTLLCSILFEKSGENYFVVSF